MGRTTVSETVYDRIHLVISMTKILRKQGVDPTTKNIMNRIHSLSQCEKVGVKVFARQSWAFVCPLAKLPDDIVGNIRRCCLGFQKPCTKIQIYMPLVAHGGVQPKRTVSRFIFLTLSQEHTSIGYSQKTCVT
jgi:hypothetical protein